MLRALSFVALFLVFVSSASSIALRILYVAFGALSLIVFLSCSTKPRLFASATLFIAFLSCSVEFHLFALVALVLLAFIFRPARTAQKAAACDDTMDPKVDLIFKYGSKLLEDSFELSSTVGVVKKTISRLLADSDASQLRLKFADRVLEDDEQLLSEIFPKGGFVSEIVLVSLESSIVKSYSKASVTKSYSKASPKPTAPRAPTPVTPVSSSDVSVSSQDSVSSQESDSFDSDSPLVTAIMHALQLPTDRIVDELHKMLSGKVHRDILIMLYSCAIQECTTTEDQTRFLVDKIVEMGLACFLHVEESFTCPICSDDFPRSHVFEFWCGLDQQDSHGGEPHALCYGCAQKYVDSKVSQGDPNITCFAPKCEHMLSMDEIAAIYGNGSAPQGKNHPHFNTIDILKRNFIVGKDPDKYAACPKGGCEYFVARSESGAIEKAVCPLCDISYCTNCRRSYHYRTTCAEVRQLEEAWRTWTVSGRAKYWQQDTEMRRKAEQFAEAERKRVEEVRKAEQEDEQWKAENCRICPHCHRVVNKLEGCSIMRCGYDTDTHGNVQDGCRNKFIWDEADPYTPVEAGANITIAAVPQQEKKRHEFWKCEECNEDIVGLRFECVNCASFSLCERCESVHSGHSAGHFFQIVEPSDTTD